MSTVIKDFKHIYVLTNNVGYSMANAVASGDVIIVFIGKHASSATDTVTDNLGNTYTSQDAINLGGSTGNIELFSALVTNPGTPSISVAAGGAGSDFGADIFSVSGLSSANVSASGGNTGASIPLSVSLNPTVDSSLFVYYLNEGGDDFVNWEGSISLRNHDANHADASGYQLDVTAGSYTPGANTTGSINNMMLAGYFPVASGGGGHNVTHANTFRNNLADLVNTQLGSGAHLVLRDGGTVDSPGTAIATLTFNTVAFNAAVNGVITAYNITADSNATGHANAPSAVTMQTSNGTVLVQFAIDGSDSSLSGGNVVASGDTVTCTSLTYNAPP